LFDKLHAFFSRYFSKSGSICFAYPDIDLAETLSCVTGKWIKRVTADPSDPLRVSEVEFADGTKQSLSKPDWRLIKPLIFWGPVV